MTLIDFLKDMVVKRHYEHHEGVSVVDRVFDYPTSSITENLPPAISSVYVRWLSYSINGGEIYSIAGTVIFEFNDRTILPDEYMLFLDKSKVIFTDTDSIPFDSELNRFLNVVEETDAFANDFEKAVWMNNFEERNAPWWKRIPKK